MKRASLVLFAAAIALYLPRGHCSAQGVSGTVSAGSPSAGIPGVIVQITDSTGRVLVRTLSRANGAFAVNAPAPGMFYLRTLRLGFKPSTFGPLAVSDAGLSGINLELHGIQISLTSVHVSARNECQSITGESGGNAILTVWEEARKVLLSTVVSRELANFKATSTIYERRVTPTDERVTYQSVVQRSGTAQRPFKSPLAADEYAERGFREDEGTGTIYRAPDADVILSDGFAKSHCLRLVDGTARSEVGLAFQPFESAPVQRADGHALVDVAGTLWLDRQSAHLLRAEFHYVGVEPVVQQVHAGGTLEFLYLPYGATVISAWRIRAPRLLITKGFGESSLGATPISSPRARERQEVKEIWIFGGELSRATVGDSSYARAADAELLGAVVEHQLGTYVPGAFVRLDGTTYTAVTDSMGRFLISGILPGRYQLLVRPESAALFGLPERSVATITLTAGEAQDVRVEAMSLGEAVAARCGKDATDGRAALFGSVMTSSRAPVPGALVHASWAEKYTVEADGYGVQRAGGFAKADSLGRFHLCGALRGRQLDIAWVADSSGGTVLVHERVRISPDSTYKALELMRTSSP
jgi:hypothetical protein